MTESLTQIAAAVFITGAVVALIGLFSQEVGNLNGVRLFVFIVLLPLWFPVAVFYLIFRIGSSMAHFFIIKFLDNDKRKNQSR